MSEAEPRMLFLTGGKAAFGGKSIKVGDPVRLMGDIDGLAFDDDHPLEGSVSVADEERNEYTVSFVLPDA